MEKNNYTKETLPNIVLQESHGDNVSILPTGATLLANSASCNVEFYSIGNRVLSFQSHPDFNRGIQQELVEPEYFIEGAISEEFHKVAYDLCGNTEYGLESRNLVFGLINQFLYM